MGFGRCGDCKFFIESDMEDPCLGQCRKYAPKPYISKEGGNKIYELFWPKVDKSMFCGDFIEKDAR